MSIILKIKIRHFLMVLTIFISLSLLALISESIKFIGSFLGFYQTPCIVQNSEEERILQDVSNIKKFGEKQVDLTFNEMPIMMWWTGSSSSRGSVKCGDQSCYFSSDRQLIDHPKVRGVFFNGKDFSATDLPLPRGHLHDWALFHDESPISNPIFAHPPTIRMFNHTATVSRTSDLPLTLQHLDSLQILTSKEHYVPVRERNRLIAYVQWNCDVPSERDDYVEELMRYTTVDSFGKCLHNAEFPIDKLNAPNDEELLSLLAKYKFVLVMENAACPDHISKQLWRTLQVGAVPIYFGSSDVYDWLPNPGAIIDISKFPSPKSLAEYLHRLDVNDKQYEGFLRHKLNPKGKKITNQYLIDHVKQRQRSTLNEFECLVCQRLAKNEKYSNMGFNTMPYNARDDHYNCPELVTALQAGGEDVKSVIVKERPVNNYIKMRPDESKVSLEYTSWGQKWHQGKYEAQVLAKTVNQRTKFDPLKYYQEVLELARSEGQMLDEQAGI